MKFFCGYDVYVYQFNKMITISFLHSLPPFLSLFFLPLEEKIDVNSIDLWSLPVKKLKKILTGWGEQCRGCLEKGDLIAKINQVKDSHLEL